MKDYEFVLVKKECKKIGSFHVESRDFLKFLPTPEEQFALAAERILVYVDNTCQTIIFKYIPEKVENAEGSKSYEVVVARVEEKHKAFVVEADNEEEAKQKALNLAFDYNFNKIHSADVSYDFEEVSWLTK